MQDGNWKQERTMIEIFILVYLCINFFLAGVAHEYKLKYSSDFTPVDRLFLYLLVILFGGVLEIINFLRFNSKDAAFWFDLNLFQKYDNLPPQEIEDLKEHLNNEHVTKKDKQKIKRILRHIENDN